MNHFSLCISIQLLQFVVKSLREDVDEGLKELEDLLTVCETALALRTLVPADQRQEELDYERSLLLAKLPKWESLRFLMPEPVSEAPHAHP